MSVLSNNTLAGSSGQGGGGGYAIDRSLRFTSGDSAYLSKNFAGSGTTKLTVSFWLKNGSAASGEEPIAWVLNFGQTSALTGAIQAYVNSTGSFEIFVRASTYGYVIATPKFRDFSAWRQIVFSIDTTESSAANQIKLWDNGQAVTSFSTQQAVTQNTTLAFGQNTRHTIGAIASSSGSLSYANMMLADFHAIDGQILAASDFGEYDDNNVWQPIEYAGTYGTNGFHLDFSDNSSNAALGTDTSGNGNTWTVNNLTAIVPTVDVGGDPTVSSTDVPFSGGYSYAFDGNDRFRVQGPGTVSGDFTIECFIKSSSYSGIQRFFSAEEGVNGSEYTTLRCNSGNTDFYALSGVYASGQNIPTNQWNHIAVTRSGSDVAYYLNGTRWATDSSSASFNITTLVLAHGYGSEYFTGSISNARFVNGQALYTGASYTVPTATLTTTSQGATASNVTTLVAHQSSATANEGTRLGINNLAAQDSLIDTPVNGNSANDTGAGGEITGNYATLNPLHKAATTTLSNGNLDLVNAGPWGTTVSTIGVSSGKWYAEVTLTGTLTYPAFGVSTLDPAYTSSYLGQQANSFVWFAYSDGGLYTAGAYTNQTGDWVIVSVAGDVIGLALDMDNGTLKYYRNGTLLGGGNAFTGITGTQFFATCGYSQTENWNFGQRPFAYTAPSGYKALCTANLPDPTIADGSTAFDTALYTGNGSTQTISGLGFSPDFVWIKRRDVGTSHLLYDQVRGTGATAELISSATYSEGSVADTNAAAYGYLNSFDTNGFTVQAGTTNGVYTNQASSTYAAWTWDAGSSTVTNTDGSISAQVRANPSAGFSIVNFTTSSGTTGGATVGHGLNAQPGMYIYKPTSTTGAWVVVHSYDYGQFAFLNSTLQFRSISSQGGGTPANPTSSVLTLYDLGVLLASKTYTAYCFAPVEGYSAMGSYVGNGSTTAGPFVYTGFRSRWLLIKRSNSTDNWVIYDTARDSYNRAESLLRPNTYGAEDSSDIYNRLDILSNGFQIRPDNTGYGLNVNGGEFIYCAFAEHPFKTSRAR